MKLILHMLSAAERTRLIHHQDRWRLDIVRNTTDSPVGGKVIRSLNVNLVIRVNVLPRNVGVELQRQAIEEALLW